jgi:hypothetical protein
LKNLISPLKRNTIILNETYTGPNMYCRQSNLWIKHPKLQTTKYSGFSYYCHNEHLHRMGMTTSPVCGSCQMGEETALHFVCVCPTLATLRKRIFGKPIMNASQFTEVSASAILQFAFQSGTLETNLWLNSLKYVRRLFNLWLLYQCSVCFFFCLFAFLFYLFSTYFSIHFSPRGGAH